MPFVAATRSLGRAGLFSLSVLRASKPTRDFFAELVREIYKIGARSLPIIAVGGAFVGLSVTLLGYRALQTYGAANQISALVGLGLTSIIVSHHVHETLPVADRALVIANGRIVFAGTPAELQASGDPL
ncbi:MAG TPA: ABC transporter permease, partial [Luteimonas sp.]|nr:ABC transporter permease [Luteimonas sp.]